MCTLLGESRSRGMNSPPWKKLATISEKASQNCMESLLINKINQTKKQPGYVSPTMRNSAYSYFTPPAAFQLCFYNGWEWKHKLDASPGSRTEVSPVCKTSLVSSFNSVLLQFPDFKRSLVSEVSVFSPRLSSGGISSECQGFAQSDDGQNLAFQVALHKPLELSEPILSKKNILYL